MSEIKVNSIKGVGASTAAITVNNTDGTCTANLSSINNGQLSGFRNLLINGAMQHNQRVQTGSLGFYNPVTASIYTLDRWRFAVGNSFDTNSARITQDSSGPDGFSKSWKMDIFNTQTPSGSENACVEQRIEAQNLQGLGYGTSAAKTMTLSFYVKSFKTGTYCVQIMQEDGTKYQLHEYSISQSNVWERKTITIVGNTSDAIDNNNDIGIRVIWHLACGPSDHVAATSSWVSGSGFKATSNQVNLWDNGSNDWFLTGCQLEIGTVASDFEHRAFGQELHLCHRYFYKTEANNWFNLIEKGSTYRRFRCEFPNIMRTTPTVSNATGVNNGSAGSPTGTQNGSTKKITFHWDSPGLVNLDAGAEFSAEL